MALPTVAAKVLLCATTDRFRDAASRLSWWGTRGRARSPPGAREQGQALAMGDLLEEEAAKTTKAIGGTCSRCGST